MDGDSASAYSRKLLIILVALAQKRMIHSREQHILKEKRHGGAYSKVACHQHETIQYEKNLRGLEGIHDPMTTKMKNPSTLGPTG